MAWLWVFLAGCNLNVPGCSREAQLMVPADCSETSFLQHGDFYDKKAYTWTRSCPGGARQAGELRLGAAMFSDTLGCQSEQGPCEPCLPSLNGDCARMGRGLFSGHLIVSGDAPRGAGLFLRCEEAEPHVAFFFEDQEGGPLSTCTADAYGSVRCSDECSMTFAQVPPPKPQ